MFCHGNSNVSFEIEIVSIFNDQEKIVCYGQKESKTRKHLFSISLMTCWKHIL